MLAAGSRLRRNSLPSSRADVARQAMILVRSALLSSCATARMVAFTSDFQLSMSSSIFAAKVLKSLVSMTLEEACSSNASWAEQGRQVSSERQLRVDSCWHSIFFKAVNL